jgi:hypothetical protein
MAGFTNGALEMDQVPLETVEAIVCHRSLKLQYEDSLFEFNWRAAYDRRFAMLLANVRFEHLSRDSTESLRLSNTKIILKIVAISAKARIRRNRRSHSENGVG